ncbi:MAG: bifunctional methylenetetrahydrofolate dehydrogenase/methenyltetrahydrofolate cyclohydrolase FolD [Erysipelotrichaceae bacterium]|nr:bifunctional methylenetetrahydrofolate dehydrogenase/methenyltetrahydrofolate cyclohydrolase FolD [Erysipelotrichaceae bacterium]
MIIDGKTISQNIKTHIKEEVDSLKQHQKRVPQLAVILVGNNPASLTYIKNKEKACAYVGFDSLKINLDEHTSERELLDYVERLNHDDKVDGILVQLPLPSHIDENKIINAINPLKDVDGFHPVNISNLFLGNKTLLPCTPYGMMVMLQSIGYDLEGKEVVVVGRSNIVGKPVALLALQKHATVTIAHSRTRNLKELTKRADVLIAAIGQPKFFDESYIKEGAIVLDVGMNRDENNKLCGDVDFESCQDKALAITPVPGGVGPMTIAMLLTNTLEAYKQRNEG